MKGDWLGWWKWLFWMSNHSFAFLWLGCLLRWGGHEGILNVFSLVPSQRSFSAPWNTLKQWCHSAICLNCSLGFVSSTRDGHGNTDGMCFTWFSLLNHSFLDQWCSVGWHTAITGALVLIRREKNMVKHTLIRSLLDLREKNALDRLLNYVYIYFGVCPHKQQHCLLHLKPPTVYSHSAQKQHLVSC